MVGLTIHVPFILTLPKLFSLNAVVGTSPVEFMHASCIM